MRQKLAKSEENLLEHRADDSKAFDTLYIDCEKIPFHDTHSFSECGFI